MAMLVGDRSRFGAFVIVSFAMGVANPAELQAQSAHPFAPPVSSPLFSLSSIATVVDANRDGSSDVIVPGIFIGSRLSTIDEDGGSLSDNVVGPMLSNPPGAYGVGLILAMASGPVDGDHLDDLVTVSSNGTVHFHKNLGSTQVDESNWASDVIVDNFSSAYPASPPFIGYSFPVAEMVDFDQDGHMDVLIGGAPVDRWSGITLPGFVCIYKGDGQGGFTPIRYDVPGVVIDLEYADLDNDGTKDAFVVLVETGQAGGFSYDVLHLGLSGSQLMLIGQYQTVGPGRLVAMEIGDVIGDGNSDYIFAQLTVTSGSASAAVYYYEGDGLGNINLSVWGTVVLPTNLTGMSDHIASLQVADFNRDGHNDLAMLRGFVSGPPAPNAPPASYGPSELLIAMGPSAVTAPLETIALDASTTFADTAVFPLIPLTSQADQLRCIDLASDDCIDFLVTGLRDLQSNAPSVVTIKNTINPQYGDSRHQKVGGPSGAVPSRPARMGFEGGRAQIGNADYACTIQNVQGGCLVGLMWSPHAIADLFPLFGFTFHMGPEQFGYAQIASGQGFRDGFYSYPLPIPNDPALVGDVGCFQYCYYDHVAGAFGGTQATCIWVGN